MSRRFVSERARIRCSGPASWLESRDRVTTNGSAGPRSEHYWTDVELANEIRAFREM